MAANSRSLTFFFPEASRRLRRPLHVTMSHACVEDGAVPCRQAPRPLELGPDIAEAHPLLDVSLTPDKGGILRREASQRRRRERQVRFDIGEDSAGKGEEPALPEALAAPTMHSSAALKQEVVAQKLRQFDAGSAVRSELGRSYKARRSVEGGATRALNVCRDQSLFQGLVSVEPPIDQLQRLTVQPRRTEPREVSAVGDAPDISAFSDAIKRFTETPYLRAEGLPPLTLQPRPRPPAATFAMFNKLREWTS
ncbi:protein phosphatase 1 regulatory subunit 35 [Gastrophryne carolinensis]